MTTPARTLADRLAQADEQRFVGRRRELELFDRILVEEPPYHVVLLHGPGGMGKSTLLREVARRGRAAGFEPIMVDGRALDPVPGEIERAVAGVEDLWRPLLLFDTFERIEALGGWMRERLLPALPAGAVIVLAGRRAPDADWMQGGWESLVMEVPLAPLGDDEALELLAAHGIADDTIGRELLRWAEGSPLALTLGADTAREDRTWRPQRLDERPALAEALVRRLARPELGGAEHDVMAVAALARATDAALLADVLPDVDAADAETWLRGLTFAEEVGDGVALHDLVRRALRADLCARDPEREAELRRRLADALYVRAQGGAVRRVVDLAELVDDPMLRWGFGADSTPRHRIDALHEGDVVALAELCHERGSSKQWWDATQKLLLEAAEPAVLARDARGSICGYAYAVTPSAAPAAAEADPVLGPWLEHAREHHDSFEGALLWRDAVDFSSPTRGDIASPVLALVNTASLLRCGTASPRYVYLPIDTGNEVAVAYAQAVKAEHVPELDVVGQERSLQCWVRDHGPGGIMRSLRDAVYRELGLRPPTPTPSTPGVFAGEDVRAALRAFHQPMELARSPIARGKAPAERAASVRAVLEEAVANAFGEAPGEQLVQRIVERGYLDPRGGHEAAAHELNVSRATYFRRLREGSERVARYVLTKGSS